MNDDMTVGTSFWPDAADTDKDDSKADCPIVYFHKVRGIVDDLAQALRDTNHPLHSIQWLWNSKARLESAWYELVAGANEIKERVDLLKSKAGALESERSESLHELAQATAQAGIVVDEAPDDPITPQKLDRALLQAAPSVLETAGQHGIEPPEAARGGLAARLGAMLLEFFGALLAGSVVGLSLGTLIGAIRLADIQRGQNVTILLVMLGIGLAVEKFIGQAVERAVASVARSREDAAFPRHRGQLLTIAFVTIAAILVISEVALETYGLRSLHHLLLLQSQRMGEHMPGVGLLPIGVYVLIGVLISCPYLASKASHAWSTAENSLRLGVILSEQLEWVNVKRQSPEVICAFKLAAVVADCDRELLNVTAELECQHSRFAALRAMAVKEAGRIHAAVDELVTQLEPIQVASVARDHFPFGEASGPKRRGFWRRPLQQQKGGA